jgi:hypothetical protein
MLLEIWFFNVNDEFRYCYNWIAMFIGPHRFLLPWFLLYVLIHWIAFSVVLIVWLIHIEVHTFFIFVLQIFLTHFLASYLNSYFWGVFIYVLIESVDIYETYVELIKRWEEAS